MRKFWMILFTVFVLSVGTSGKADTVQAKETDPSETAVSGAVEAAVRSRGSIIYQESGAKAAVYAEDFMVLRDRLAAIPENAFDPLCYTHTHKWEYQDINEKTHTRHCDSCGAAYDLVSVHTADREEDYPITCDGKTYSGRRYTCVCGYQWIREAAHELVYEAVDETNHRIRCALQDTGFCRGFEPVVEEHYAYTYVPCTDGVHHKIICMDCGYTAGEKNCSFTWTPNPDEGDERDPALLYCECGNAQNASSTAGAETTNNAEASSDSADMPEESPAESEEAEGPEENPAGSEEVGENPVPADTSEENPTGNGDIGKSPASPDTPVKNPTENKDTGKNPTSSDTPEESSAENEVAEESGVTGENPPLADPIGNNTKETGAAGQQAALEQ